LALLTGGGSKSPPGGIPASDSVDEALLNAIRPIVQRALDRKTVDGLKRGDLAGRVKAIAAQHLHTNRIKLNMLDERNLVTALMNELLHPEGVDAQSQSDPSAPNGSADAKPLNGAVNGHANGQVNGTAAPMQAGATPEIQAPKAPVPDARCTPQAPKEGDKQTITTSRDSIDSGLQRVRPVLMERIDVSAAAKLSRDVLAAEVSDICMEILHEEKINLNSLEQRDLVTILVNDMLGLGPLEPLLADDSVTDILVNGAKQIYVERKGKLELTDVTFRDDNHVMQICMRIVSKVGRRVDESSPLCDARLEDGSRVNIIIPPLAIDGPSISIRKFAKQKITLDKMVGQGNISASMATVLQIAGRAQLNILISGGTGSGKTTMLNALSRQIDAAERVVTIEDAAELQMQQPHVVRLETRPPNLEGDGEVTMRDLVKNALRMRPDRIILGEVRSSEAVDMLQAMNTGHEGSMCTIHANNPREALTRLENMVGMAGINLPSKAVRTQIASALDIIIQVSRMRDGMRRVTHVSEVVGMEGDIITTQDLYNYKFEGEDPNGMLIGQFEPSKLRPHFAPKAAYFGLERALLEAVG